jgi:hypothetical protein
MTPPRWQRYPPGLDFISFSEPPRGVTPEAVPLEAHDGGTSRGVLYARGTERTIVCLVHPRADMTRHYAIPALLEAGYAFFAQESRWPGNDVVTQHEMLLADVAAAMVFVRSRGFKQVVLLGNSGAGPLYALYQAQATTAPPHRLTDTAAGDPYDLNTVDMPAAAGMIFLGAHLGPGKILQTEIDPSVIDEDDPRSRDPALDMYDPRNGFREPPATSSYAPDFLTRYRAGQEARVRRIDAIARNALGEEGRVLHVAHVDASPGSTDPAVYPSARSYGSLMSVRPDLSNDAPPGTKNLSPRAWLSSWSGPSSRASLLDSLPSITIPTLVANYAGDNAIYPVYAERIYEASPAADKSRLQFDGDHFGLGPEMKRSPGPGAGPSALAAWLRERFP